MSFEATLKDLKNKIYRPVYLLQGDEPYYIDLISDYMENELLPESEKDFNLMVVYGNEVTTQQLVDSAGQYPMFGNYKVIIVKEAQQLRFTEREMKVDGKAVTVPDPIVTYLENPQPTTILCFCYKYKNVDKRKKVGKAFHKHALVLTSKGLYENQVADWMRSRVEEKGMKIEPKATALLIEYVGTDLSKLNNELEKLRLGMNEGDLINAKVIEEKVGISKDYNVFEFQKALGSKDREKAYRIVNYFEANPAAQHIVLITSILQGYFTKILKLHQYKNTPYKELASKVGVNGYFLKDYTEAANNYPPEKLESVIALLKEVDLRSKGVSNAPSIDSGQLLREMTYRLLN